jgi:hypothetical protein
VSWDVEICASDLADCLGCTALLSNERLALLLLHSDELHSMCDCPLPPFLILVGAPLPFPIQPSKLVSTPEFKGEMQNMSKKKQICNTHNKPNLQKGCKCSLI